MNATAYKRNIPTPYRPAQATKRQPFTQPPRVNPIREEIEALVGTHNIVCEVEEDQQAITDMGNVNGTMIAFVATLSKDGHTISQGRGCGILNQNNRYVSRVVSSAFGAAICDAMVRAKVLGTLHGNPSANSALDDAYKARDIQESSMATSKQLDYLKQLAQMHIEDEGEREGFLNEIEDFSRDDASNAIQEFLK